VYGLKKQKGPGLACFFPICTVQFADFFKPVSAINGDVVAAARKYACIVYLQVMCCNIFHYLVFYPDNIL
jgi:hypothetical protein